MIYFRYNITIVENDLKEALAQLAVIVELTNKFEDIYSIRINVVYSEQGERLSCTIQISIEWQSNIHSYKTFP